MKLSSRRALAAALALAASVFPPRFDPAQAAGGAAPPGRPAMAMSGLHRGARIAPGPFRARGPQAVSSRARARTLHRALPDAGYAPYPDYAPYEPAPAPVYVQAPTPVYVSVPAAQPAAPVACVGPRIIEIGKPVKSKVPLPRVIYGIPMSCIATHDAGHGPGIYTVD